jgi:hypothetical protein
MTDQIALQSQVSEKSRSVRFWFATAALVPYGAVIVALFGGFAFDHLPERSGIRFAIVASGAWRYGSIATRRSENKARPRSPSHSSARIELSSSGV